MDLRLRLTREEDKREEGKSAKGDITVIDALYRCLEILKPLDRN